MIQSDKLAYLTDLSGSRAVPGGGQAVKPLCPPTAKNTKCSEQWGC